MKRIDLHRIEGWPTQSVTGGDAIKQPSTKGGQTVKLRYLAVLAVTAIALACASSAVARKSFPTTITHDSSVALGATFVLDSGHVSSPQLRCRFLRLVTLIGHYPSGRTKLLDVDLTSVRGAWATKADLTGTDRVRATVTRTTFRRHGHRKVCGSDFVVFQAP